MLKHYTLSSSVNTHRGFREAPWSTLTFPPRACRCEVYKGQFRDLLASGRSVGKDAAALAKVCEKPAATENDASPRARAPCNAEYTEAS